MQSITVSWPARALSPNVTASWRRKYEAKKTAKAEAFALAKQAKVGGGAGPFRVSLNAYPKHERNRDHDNLLASCKAHLDGLALAMGVDDSLFRPSINIHPADGRGVVVISVEAMEQ